MKLNRLLNYIKEFEEIEIDNGEETLFEGYILDLDLEFLGNRIVKNISCDYNRLIIEVE